MNRRTALEALYARIRADLEYRSEAMGTAFVPGSGSPEAGVVFVGEAPGRDEERLGAPFVGAAGRNLAALLEAAGLSRERVFITNLVKYRPLTPGGGNRRPSPAETRRALPYLLDELAVLSPRLVVCLGAAAAEALLSRRPLRRMAEANGALFSAYGLRLLVTYHPSPFNYLSPEKRRAMREAFGRIREYAEGV